MPKLIPIGEPRKGSTDAYYLDIIFRLPWALCFLYLPLIMMFKSLHSLLRFVFKQPYTNISPVKRHRYQPAFYFRLPLFPGIVSMLLTTIWQTIVFYLVDKFKDFSVSGILKNLLKSFAFHYLVSVVLRGNSIIFPPEMMANVYRVLDPLGETGQRYHFIFDEVFRADNYENNHGGFHRSQRAKELWVCLRDVGQERRYKFGVLGVLLELIRSFDPGYQVRQ